MENVEQPNQVSDNEMRELIAQGRELLLQLRELNARLDKEIAESNENKRTD